MGEPVNIIYSLLQSQISKLKSEERSDLKIETRVIGGLDTYYFNKKDLQNWKSVSLIKELGLLDIKQSLKDGPSDAEINNQRKATGMLVFLLANLSLEIGNARMKFTKKSDVANVSYNRLYEFFKERYLDDKERYLDDASTKFPSKNMITPWLEESYEDFLKTIYPRIVTRNWLFIPTRARH